jgi:hypothetical protein
MSDEQPASFTMAERTDFSWLPPLFVIYIHIAVRPSVSLDGFPLERVRRSLPEIAADQLRHLTQRSWPPVKIFCYNLSSTYNLDFVWQAEQTGWSFTNDTSVRYQSASEMEIHSTRRRPLLILNPEEANLFFVPFYVSLYRRLRFRYPHLASQLNHFLIN